MSVNLSVCLRMEESVQQLLERYPLSGGPSSMLPFLPPSLLGPAGASGALHPLLGVPVLRTPVDLLAQQYLSALAAAAAVQTPSIPSSTSSATVNDHSASRSESRSHKLSKWIHIFICAVK